MKRKKKAFYVAQPSDGSHNNLPTPYSEDPEMICPVGKEHLGYRQPWEYHEKYCGDCNHTYEFEPYNPRPVANFRGKAEDKLCGCPQCR